jgi:hypothetical protein
MAMAPHMPVAALARRVREHDTRVWRILQFHANRARSDADHSTLKQVDLDETSRGKGHDCVTLFVDVNPLKRRVLYCTPGKDASTVPRFAEDLKDHGGHPSAIEDVRMDMSVASRAARRATSPTRSSPSTSTTSIIKLLNEAEAAENLIRAFEHARADTPTHACLTPHAPTRFPHRPQRFKPRRPP